MATNREIREALLAKLEVTPSRLSQLVGRRKKQLPMDTPEAVYTIAHENGVDISKHLGADETAKVRGLVATLRQSGGVEAAPGPEPRKAKRAPSKVKDVKVTIGTVDIGKVPALKPSHAAEAKRMSERVYPTLYVFENSLRDLIEAVLKAEYGKDWWDEAVPKKVRTTADEHKVAEAEDGWHDPRGGRPIDYIFLTDLWAIIKDKWPKFKHLFPDQAWIQTLITRDMNVSRRVLAHMTPLSADDIVGIETAFRKWVKQLQAVEDQIP